VSQGFITRVLYLIFEYPVTYNLRQYPKIAFKYKKELSDRNIDRDIEYVLYEALGKVDDFS